MSAADIPVRTRADLVPWLEAIEDCLDDDTIVVYLTDNGSTMGARYFDAGMRGAKISLWEGGHRVPLFVRWPAAGIGGARRGGPLR
mgnify:CR=1 FL=1